MLQVLKRTVSATVFFNPKQMLKWMDKKIFTILRSKFLLNRTYGSIGTMKL